MNYTHDFANLACDFCVIPDTYCGISIYRNNGYRVCSFCHQHEDKSFQGADALSSNLNLEKGEKVGVTVSGGKDSLYAWMKMVEILGSEKVVAFNHNKVDLVHPVAMNNLRKAQERLKTELVIVRDDIFLPRFKKNLKAFLDKPDAAMIKVALCAGCRYGIRGRMFEEGLKFGISKYINANSYLEQNPFKLSLLEKRGGGSYRDGILNCLYENSRYQHSDNIETIKKDHEYWPSGEIFSSMPEFYSQIQHFSFDRYFPNNPFFYEEEVKKNLSWEKPMKSWHFDCQVESFKDLFYYGLLGHTELENKLSSMVRHRIISRDYALQRLYSYREKIKLTISEVHKLCEELDIQELIPKIDNFCKESRYIRTLN
ncbi:MAG: hypothetical protein U5L10_01185 [Candidatus Moranbacteria bacterium]|nr:hypothetical protein [Candidatus Moranbacteria bacterium]